MTSTNVPGVAVTRAEEPGGPLAGRLAARGLAPVAWRALATAPPADAAPLERALAGLAAWDWIALTSRAAVEAVVSRVAAPVGKPRVAAVGPATAAALAEAGWPVDRIGEGPGAEGLVAAFRAAGDARGARVLFPAGDLARTELADGLAVLGARVDRVEAYRTLAAGLAAEACRADVDAGRVAAVTFASPSALDAFAAALGRAAAAELLARVAVVSIGPTTSAALAAFGRAPDREAAASTLDGLADAAFAVLASPAPSNRPAAPVSAAAHAAVVTPSGDPQR